MQRVEQAIQRAILTLLFRAYPAGFVFHVPNSAKRSKIDGYNMKLNGVKSGVSDLVIVRPNKRVAWIEVKDPNGGVLSDNQKKFAGSLALMGHIVHVITDPVQLLPIIEVWKREDTYGL